MISYLLSACIFFSCFPGFPVIRSLSYESHPLFLIVNILTLAALNLSRRKVNSAVFSVNGTRKILFAGTFLTCSGPSLLLFIFLLVYPLTLDSFYSSINILLSFVGGSLFFCNIVEYSFIPGFLSKSLSRVLNLLMLSVPAEFFFTKYFPSLERTEGIRGKLFATEPSTLTAALIVLLVLSLLSSKFILSRNFLKVFLVSIYSLLVYFPLTIFLYLAVVLVTSFLTYLPNLCSSLRIKRGLVWSSLLLSFLTLSFSFLFVVRPRFQVLFDAAISNFSSFVSFSSANGEYRVLQLFSAYSPFRILGQALDCDAFNRYFSSLYEYSVCGASAPFPQLLIIHGMYGLLLGFLYLICLCFLIRPWHSPFFPRTSQSMKFLGRILPGIVICSLFVSSSRSYPFGAFALMLFIYLSKTANRFEQDAVLTWRV